jgi:hypothetical protein
MKNAPGEPGAFLFVGVCRVAASRPYRSNAAFSALRCGTSGLPIEG